MMPMRAALSDSLWSDGGLGEAMGGDQAVYCIDCPGSVLLDPEPGLGEGFRAGLAQGGLETLVLAEPALQGALADFGLARGGDNRRGIEWDL